MIKRTALLLIAICAPLLSLAQPSAAEFKEKYDRQVRNTGYDGVGVETILDRWEAAFPDDCNMLEGRFLFYLTRSRTVGTRRSPRDRFMGKEPVMSLKDSLGNPVHFFEEEFYSDSLFNIAIRFVSRAILLEPHEFLYRADLLNAQIAREKEEPLVSVEELDALISYDKAHNPKWKFRSGDTEEGFFASVVQEYCRLYFDIGTERSYAAFRRISERMCKLYPKRLEFLSNLGSYWKVAGNNPGKALGYYKKVLSKDPRNYVAAKNCYIIARSQNNLKAQKTYLAIIAETSPSEAERLSAKTLLESMK